MPKDKHTDFNYGVFSFRTGNIYSVALLKQWIDWALDGVEPETLETWETDDGRFIDPFRPAITPDGFESREALFEARRETLKAISDAFSEIDIFVFTLGLTEAWVNTETGCVYPMCPGTLAGTFDPVRYRFVNYQYPEIRKALRSVIERVRGVNPSIRFLLTVSPVPLTATASGQHVLTATIHSKSILRAVAGDISQTRKDADYFPSFEIISAFPFKGMFYQPNQRNVAPEGVDFVMKAFFECQKTAFGETREAVPPENPDALDEEVCEEALLDGFSGETRQPPSNDAAQQICIVGNSHLGVVRQAWQTGLEKGFLDTSLTFFGAPGQGFLTLSPGVDAISSDNEKVQAGFEKTSGGLREAVYARYDKIIVYGAGFPLKWLVAQLDKLSDTTGIQSDDLLLKSLRDRIAVSINDSPFVKLAIEVRKRIAKPIFLAMAPMWSVLEKQASPKSYEVFCRYEQILKTIYIKTLSETLAPHDITLIGQAAHTLDSPCFTKEEYIMGYGKNVRDHGHMSIDYGAVVVEEVMKYLELGDHQKSSTSV